ncbi:MAG: energy transducer TonB [Thermoanaerobaculia bacterium]
MKRTLLLSIGLSLGFSARALVGAQEVDYYEAQLRAGRSAFTAQRVPQAIHYFRVASFGLLDRPPLLSEALARLAVACDAAGDSEARGAALDRLVRVEQRFAGLPPSALEPEIRAVLRRLLEARVPRETLAAIPSLAPATPAKPRPRTTAGSNRTTPPPPRPTPAASGSQADESAARGAAPGSAPAPPPARASGNAEPDAVYAPPRYRATVKPLYPASALRSRIGGIVLLRVLVSESGEPVEIEVVREVHPDLSAAAVGAVRRWEFEPARRNGVPVAAWTTVPIPFRPQR